MEAGMPTEAYRDWGKLSRKLGNNTEAKIPSFQYFRSGGISAAKS